MAVTIALDCMGGDHGVTVTVPAAVQFLDTHPEANIILVGQVAAIEATLGRDVSRFGERLKVKDATEVVTM